MLVCAGVAKRRKGEKGTGDEETRQREGKKTETGMKGELELFGASVPGRREGQGKRRRQDETKRKKEETQRREGSVWRKCSFEVRMNVCG